MHNINVCLGRPPPLFPGMSSLKAEFLLQRGIDPDIRAKGGGETALMVATLKGRRDHIRVADALLRAGADLSAEDVRIETLEFEVLNSRTRNTGYDFCNFVAAPKFLVVGEAVLKLLWSLCPLFLPSFFFESCCRKHDLEGGLSITLGLQIKCAPEHDKKW